MPRASPRSARHFLRSNRHIRRGRRCSFLHHCLHSRLLPRSHFCHGCVACRPDAELTQSRTFLGIDSARSFYFAPQQLSIWGAAGFSQPPKSPQELPVSLAKNIDFLRRLPKLGHLNGFGYYGRSQKHGLRSPLVEVTGFGSNPGGLKMFSYVPANLPPRPALVVVLHGCGQSAAGYDLGAGWSTIAKRYGFALLMPEQQAANNANTCFNWFNPDDVARDQGEACSIRQMIAKMVSDHGISRRRIYV